MIDGRLVAEYSCKALHIVAGETLVHFSVAAEFAAHQVMRAIDTRDGIAVRLQGDKDLAGNGRLCILQEPFDVAHGRVEHLSFMERVAVPAAELVLPIEQPLGQGMFFKQVGSLDDDEGGGGFETDAAFDADDGVTDMDIAADAIGLGDGLEILDGFY